jgi:ATP/maltotriose-dependent transcriptional regulator MalT
VVGEARSGGRVSANTIKTHTQAIYRKLGVSGRFDAVEAARLLGL